MTVKNLKILNFALSFSIFIFAFSIFLATPIQAGAFSECRSDRKGYCVRLDPPAPPQTARRGISSFLFAAPPKCSKDTAFPGLEFLAPFQINSCSEIGDILGGLYKFGVAIAGISALIWLSFGGILVLTARESPSQVSKAWGYINNALYGLVVIVLSYLILYTINPDFTYVLKIPDLIEPGAKTAPAPAGAPAAPPTTPVEPVAL